MWGKKKHTSLMGTTTLVASGTEIVGDISFSGHLEIEGSIKGNVIAASDSDAFIRLLANGVIEGNINAPVVVINGRVEGDVHSKQVELAGNAEIHGDIYYDAIEIARGAHINGQLVYQGDITPKVALVADNTGDKAGAN